MSLFLSSRILKPHENAEGNIFLRGLQRLIHGSYAKLLDKALKHPVITIIIAVLIFIGSLQLIPVIGVSLFPASEKPQFIVDISAPQQSNIYYTDTITRQIEKDLKQFPEIKYYASNVGKGNPRIYYNVNQQNEHTDLAEIFVQLQPDIDPKRKVEIIEMLRKNGHHIPALK